MKRARTEIFLVGKKVQVEMESHRRIVKAADAKRLFNMEWWMYRDGLSLLCTFIAAMTKAGVCVQDRMFEDGVIRCHDLIAKETLK